MTDPLDEEQAAVDEVFAEAELLHQLAMTNIANRAKARFACPVPPNPHTQETLSAWQVKNTEMWLKSNDFIQKEQVEVKRALQLAVIAHTTSCEDIERRRKARDEATQATEE